METQEIQTVPYTMQVPKEGKEIVDFAAQITALVIEGKVWDEIITLMEPARAAVQDAGKVAGEVRSQYKDELAGYTVHKLWGDVEAASKKEE